MLGGPGGLARRPAARQLSKRRAALSTHITALCCLLGLCLLGLAALNRRWLPGQEASYSAANGPLRRRATQLVYKKANWQSATAASSSDGSSSLRPRFPVTRDDLVVALPTHLATEGQLFAGRSARLGLRTLVVTNYTESAQQRYPAAPNEVWTSYPDSEPLRSFYAGDARAALAPFIAYQTLGDTFKWLFYGDDDTVLFADAALQLASRFDPQQPLFLSDNLWWSDTFGGAWHPHPQAPRCLPCGYHGNANGAIGIAMAAGCPCTPQLICSLQGSYNGTFGRRGCGVPRAPVRSYSMHGGAGALISVGLLRRIDWPAMERCVSQQWSSGGDAFITQCLWEQGAAVTDPGPLWHPAGLQMFDPSPVGPNPDDFILWKAGHVVGNLLQLAAGSCAGLCQLEVQHTVTLHLRSRRTGGSDAAAAAFIAAFSRLYTRLTGMLTLAEQQRLTDTTSARMAAVLAQIDQQMQAGIQAVRQLASLQPAALPAEGLLEVRTRIGRLGAGDAARAAVADAVAARLLANMLQLAKSLAPLQQSGDREKPSGLIARILGV